MDLSTIDTTETANEGAVLELRGPDDAPLFTKDGAPVTITLLGKDSDVYTRVVNANANRHLNQRGKPKRSIEGAKAEGVSLLAKCTTAWSGIVVEGETLDCTYENAVKLYSRFSWIMEQVDEFVADRANFTKASPTG